MEHNSFDLLLLISVPVLIWLLFHICYLYYIKNPNKGFLIRKFIHTISGLFILIIPLFHNTIYPVLTSLLIVFFLLLLNKKSRLFNKYFNMIAENEELELGYLQGPIAFALSVLSITILNFLFPTHLAILISALLSMIIGDTLAAIIGKKYGKHKIIINNKLFNRSIEGSSVMLISTLILSLIVFIYLNVFNLLRIILLSIVATLVELFSPSKWDDLLIPTLTSVIMILLSVFI